MHIMRRSAHHSSTPAALVAAVLLAACGEVPTTPEVALPSMTETEPRLSVTSVAGTGAVGVHGHLEAVVPVRGRVRLSISAAGEEGVWGGARGTVNWAGNSPFSVIPNHLIGDVQCVISISGAHSTEIAVGTDPRNAPDWAGPVWYKFFVRANEVRFNWHPMPGSNRQCDLAAVPSRSAGEPTATRGHLTVRLP